MMVHMKTFCLISLKAIFEWKRYKQMFYTSFVYNCIQLFHPSIVQYHFSYRAVWLINDAVSVSSFQYHYHNSQ